MADTDSPTPGNGAFWNNIREGFVFFRSREAETPTATAATTLRSAIPTVRDVSLNRVDTREGADETESDEAGQSSRGSSIRYATRYALASLDGGTPNNYDLEDVRAVYTNGEPPIEDDEPDNEDGETAMEYESTLAAETPLATPNAAKYLSKLQPVPINDLSEDFRTCGICQEIYNTGDEPEEPCLVGQCGHILGRTCLSRWAMPEGRRPNKTCPLCRAVLFEDDTPGLPHAFDDINGELFLGFLEGLVNEREGWEEDEAFLPDLLTGEDEPLDEDEFDEPEIEGERYASAFLEAVSASLQALEAWDRIPTLEAWNRIRNRQHERAGAGIVQPPYIFSESVLTFFRRFVHRSNVGHSATISVGSSLRYLMGQLYTRLREDMESTAMPVVWTESGPPLSLLIDPATIPLIETALERLVDIERQWYEADR